MGAWGLGIFQNDSAQDALCQFHEIAEAMANDLYSTDKEGFVKINGIEYGDELIYRLIDTLIDRECGNILYEEIRCELEEIDNKGKWANEERVITLAKLEWMILGNVSYKERVIEILRKYINNFLEHNSVRDKVSKKFRKANKDDIKDYQEFLDAIISDRPPETLKDYREAISEATGCDIIKMFIELEEGREEFEKKLESK